jgi:hypothetical protein
VILESDKHDVVETVADLQIPSEAKSFQSEASFHPRNILDQTPSSSSLNQGKD